VGKGQSRIAFPDFGSWVVVRLSDMKRNSLLDSYVRRGSKKGQLCVTRINFFSGSSWLVTGLVTVDGNR
jgi:hypothetical protein